MKKLEKLLYRKATLERLMNIWSKGIVLYNKYIDACKAVMADSNRTELERAEAEKNMHEADIPLKHYITSFKLAKRDLHDGNVVENISNLGMIRAKCLCQDRKRIVVKFHCFVVILEFSVNVPQIVVKRTKLVMVFREHVVIN